MNTSQAMARRICHGVVASVVAASLCVPLVAVGQSLPWMNPALTPEQRTTALLGAMTQDQKYQQMVGAPGIIAELPQCYGARHVPGIGALQIPTLRITNGPVGVGQGDCVPPNTPGLPTGALTGTATPKATALPSAMAVAASFDRTVATQFGDVIGRETRDLALHVMEGPGINMARVYQGGRNFEYFGEDPYLTGSMAAAEIRAIQAHGVIAMAKHIVANDQEVNRMTINEIIDDRVLRELYLLPFEMAVKDGDVASVMCSYNRVNGAAMCENKYVLTDILRGEWGFQGYVQSDFFALRSAVPTLLAGMDHEMPGINLGVGNFRVFWTPAALNAALAANQIKQSDIDQALRRRYIQMFKLGIFDRPLTLTPIDASGNGAIARTIGEQSAVLLKNAGSILPFNAASVRSIALIGKADYASKSVAGCCGGSSDVIPLYTVTPLQGVQNVLAATGSTASVSLTVVTDNNSNLNDAVAAAASADVVVVLAGTIAEEGADNASIALPKSQDAMITALAAANPRTVVVMKDNASALMPWIDSVPAVLEAWFPGQEDGNIVARLVFGLANPSGKSPVTYPRLASQVPTNTPQQYPGVTVAGTPTITYSEGLQMGYRWYDAQGVQPLFPFGHGLSYTTFAMSALTVTPKASDGTQPIAVEFFVENTGSRPGAEVPQIYLGMPSATGEPPKRLVGFEKVWLNPGEKKKVRIVIDPAASNHPLSYWDSGSGGWKVAPVAYPIYVGRSSRDIALQALTVIRPDPNAILVTKGTDDGSEGTLRAAILKSNAEPGRYRIVFVPPSTGDLVIKPTTLLPGIIGPAKLEGPWRGTGMPRVILDGSAAIDLSVLVAPGLPRNCPGEIAGQYGPNARSLQGAGLKVRDSKNVEFSGFEVRNFCIGIMLHRSSNNYIHHMRFYNNRGTSGVLLTGDDETPAGGGIAGSVDGNVIEYNMFLNNSDGLDTSRGPTNTTIRGNTLIIDGEGFPSSGIEATSAGLIIEDNVVQGFATGIILFGNDNVLRRNTLTNNAIAVQHFGGTRIAFEQNEVTGNRAGLLLTGGNNVLTLTQNALFDNGKDISRCGPSNTGSTATRDGGVCLQFDWLTSPFSLSLNSFGTPVANDNGSTCADGFADCTGQQNRPVLTTSRLEASGFVVGGTLTTRPNQEFIIEYYASHATGPLGRGDGEVYLGNQRLTTNSSGVLTLNFPTGTTDPLGDGTRNVYFTAIATSVSSGKSSDFSVPQLVAAP